MRAHSSKRAMVLVVLACAGVALIGSFFSVNSQAVYATPALATAATPAPRGGHIINPAARLPTGQPAIQANAGLASPSNASSPVITSQEVASFVRMHRMPHTLGPVSPVVVDDVALLTSREVSARLDGESTGLPDGTLLYLAEVHGTCTFPGPANTAFTYTRGFEVFDAHTGNLLIWGGRS